MAENGNRSPLFQESPLGIVVLDRGGRVMDLNDAACKDLARPRDRLLDRPFSEWVLPGDRPRMEEAVHQVLQGRRSEWRARLRRGDGMPRIHQLHGSPLRRGDSVEAVLLFLRDFSEKGEGRPETRQLQTLMENLPGQFVVMTDKKGRIRHASGLGRTHFRDNTTVLGLSYQELLGPDRKGESNLEDLLGRVGDGESWAGVQWHRRKDGVSFPVEVFANPHLDVRTGQVLGILIVGRDLSVTRKWREIAEEARPLAQIGSLTARIAEEIRLGLTRLEGIVPASVEARGAGIGWKEAREELDRLKRFLAAIEEFGERGTPRQRSISLADRAHGALERASGRMASQGIQPVLEVPPNLPPVFADEGCLDQILDRLLENALDALEGSPIPLLRLDLRKGAEGILLRMTNSGSTVQKDWVGEIFDPFFTTRKGHPGLGLAVVRGLMESNGGRIWAQIPQDGFLAVVLEFPIEASGRVIPFRPTPLNLARSRSVLVVDDDESIRGAVKTFLEKVGYEVKEAWSGRSALAQLTSGRLPELVLTDLKMADGSGYWFMEEMGRDFPALVKRTIIVTGDADHEMAYELTRQTGCPLVRKPFELPELLEVLDGVLAGG